MTNIQWEWWYSNCWCTMNWILLNMWCCSNCWYMMNQILLKPILSVLIEILLLTTDKCIKQRKCCYPNCTKFIDWSGWSVSNFLIDPRRELLKSSVRSPQEAIVSLWSFYWYSWCYDVSKITVTPDSCDFLSIRDLLNLFLNSTSWRNGSMLLLPNIWQ